MARALYKKQKKIIKDFVESFPINRLPKELPCEVMDELEKIHDYETLWQDVDRYFYDVRFERIYNNLNFLGHPF